MVVLDAQNYLSEGQPVRVESVEQTGGSQEQADRVRKLQQLFAEWTEEDGKLSNAEADLLQNALEQTRGLGFRVPNPA